MLALDRTRNSNFINVLSSANDKEHVSFYLIPTIRTTQNENFEHFLKIIKVIRSLFPSLFLSLSYLKLDFFFNIQNSWIYDNKFC